MTMIFFSLILFSTLMFLISETPMLMGFFLIFMTFMLSFFFSMKIKSMWSFYLLMLVFIGGMLILFIYVTSIFPNKKTSFNQANIYFLFSSFILILCTLFFMNLFFNFDLPLIELKNLCSMFMNQKMLITNKIFCSHSNWIIIFLVNYLFFCMIIVVKITNFFSGPLRKFYVQIPSNSPPFN